MRVVVDTNILVSALIRPDGTVGSVLKHLRDGAYTLLYSKSSLEELVDVLTRPKIQGKYGLTEDDVETVLALLLARGEAVVVTRRITVCRDPKDDQFLEIGVADRADIIVSGDEDLLVIDCFEKIPILSSTEFLDRLDQKEH